MISPKFKYLFRKKIKYLILFFLRDFLIINYLKNRKFPLHNSRFLISITVENLNENPNLISKYHEIFKNDFQKVFWNSKIGINWHNNIELGSLKNEYYNLISNHLSLTEFKTILDVGCGFGLLTYRLSNKYPECSFLGIDISKNSIKNAKIKYSNVNLEYSQKTLKDVSKKFDLIICLNTIDYVDPNSIKEFINRMFILSNQIIIITSLRGLSYNEFLNLKDSVKITRYDIGYIHPIYKMLISLHVDFKIKKCGFDSILITISKI